MDQAGIEYIATAISNLAVVDVRLYRGGSLAFRHAPVPLPADPITPYIERILAIEESVGYFIADDYFYYGIVRAGDLSFVIGPMRETIASDLSYRQMGIMVSVTPEEIDRFIAAMKSMGLMPFYTALQILCVMGFVMNGERVDVKDLIIHDDAQEMLTKQLAEESFRRNEFRNVLERGHSSMQIEQALTDLIRRGKTDELKEYLGNLPTFRVGTLSPDRMRHEKNTFITSATLMSRAALAGGVDPDDALTLSDSYINRCELLSNLESINDLYYHMCIEYAEMVRRVRIGENPSKLALRVADYVRRHIFEPIKTGDIAKALYVSRGFLSTRFKQETGRSLSAFIQEEKVEEAKRLLVNTDQPLLAIGTYLGYSSQSHFNTAFKRYVGLTPRAYRTRHA